jgi:hypothetical protein
METQVTNQQFFIGGFVLIVVAFLLLTAFRLYRRRKKLQSIRAFSLHFDPTELDRAAFSQSAFEQPGDLYAFSQRNVLGYESPDAVPQSE